MSQPKIDESMTIPQIINHFPHTLAVFKRYGLNPEGYKALEFENLVATTKVHQIDLKTLLKDLNQSIS